MELEFVPPPGDVKGCFLIFDVVSEGTLFTHWGENISGQVIAFFEPNKTVPVFKYREGRKELMRKFRGDKSRFYQGISQFFKLAKDYNGSCVLLCPSIAIYLRSSANGEVVRLQPGGELVPLAPFSAVVALPQANTSIAPGASLMQEQFLRIGVSEGGGVSM